MGFDRRGGTLCRGGDGIAFRSFGTQVLLLERGEIATDTLSTHVLTPPAIARLDVLGLLDGIRALGAPPIRTMVTEFDGESYARPVGGPHGFIAAERDWLQQPVGGAELALLARDTARGTPYAITHRVPLAP